MRRIQLLLGAACVLVLGACGDSTSYDCADRVDCANHGDCVEGICDCDQGFAGIHCSTCDLYGGYVSDGAGGCMIAPCEDLDGDTREGYDEQVCPLGDDRCDDDPDNWTVGGCNGCTDADGDGRGMGCDRGRDCDDADDTIWEGCNACVDNDGDHHGVNCSDGPDCNDNDPTVYRGCYRVVYWGDFDTDGLFEVASQFFPGGDRSKLTLAGMDTSAPLGGVAVSPGGAQVAVAATDASGLPVLALYTLDATSAPLMVAAGATGESIIQPSFSPEGDLLAFLWNQGGGAFGLYVVDATGGTPRRVSPSPGCPSCDVTFYRWAQTQGATRHVAFLGDVEADGQVGLWGVEVTAASPLAQDILSTAEATTPSLVPLLGFDNVGRVYFRSDFEVAGTYRIYRANLDGSGREQVPGTTLVNGGGEASVGSFGLSGTGTMLAVSIDAPAAGLFQVYVLDVSAADPDRVSNVTAAPPGPGSLLGPEPGTPIVWGPEEEYLAVTADWPTDASDMDDAYGLFVLPATGNGGVRLLGVPNNAGQDVLDLAFAPSGQRIFAQGDLVANDNMELFFTEDIWSVDVAPVSIRIEDVPTGGDVFGFVVVAVQ